MINSCVFCDRILHDEIEGEKRDVVWFEPLHPVTPGHMLFVPREHVMDLEEKPWVTGQVAEVAASYARRQCVDANLITSMGALATQSILHLHIHYVPRRVDDGLLLPWNERS